MTKKPARQLLPQQWPQRLLLVALLWSLPGVLYSIQLYQSGKYWWGEISWWQAFLVGMPTWWIFIPVTFAVAAITRRHPVEARMGLRSIAVHVVAWLALTLLMLSADSLWYSLARDFWPSQQYGFSGWMVTLATSTHVQLMSFGYLLVVLVTHALEQESRRRREELREAQRLAELARAQVTALNQQLQPHFLLNALNAVSTQILRGDHRSARAMLAALGRFLSRVLALENRETVLLAEELDLVEEYVEIQQARWCERLQVKLDVDARARPAQVPPLLLQPLVENAIQHGLAALDGGGEIVIRARRDGARLAVAIENDGIGLARQWRERAEDAIGLANTRKRLQHVFPEHSFDLSASPNGRVCARLEIPFMTEQENPDRLSL